MEKKYRYRPSMVDEFIYAMQFTNETKKDCYKFVQAMICADYDKDKPFLKIQNSGDRNIFIVYYGDFIIKNYKNKYYSCPELLFYSLWEECDE